MHRAQNVKNEIEEVEKQKQHKRNDHIYCVETFVLLVHFRNILLPNHDK